jgi:hypothetical protein
VQRQVFKSIKVGTYELSVRVILVGLLIAALPCGVLGQDRTASAVREQLSSVPRSLPVDVLEQVRALGDRMRTPGKEETLLTGQFTDASGKSKAIQVIHQISGMVRIEGVRENRPLAFDGDLSRGAVDRSDESLLETFVMDTVEGMAYSLRSGGAMQLLGRRFGPDARTVRDYKGPWFDIYEVTAPTRSRQDRQLRMKRYYFDSDTRLLISTRYTDPAVSPSQTVETRFSNWQQLDGSVYPGRIERYENGQLAFSIVVTTASGRPRHDSTNFR